jgi:hypothetical protein
MAILYKNTSGKPFRATTIRRNDPCPCGSGKKAKNCCGATKEYFILKPKPQNDDSQQHQGGGTVPPVAQPDAR